PRRFKVRTRSYLDSGVCSLEVKTRERRGITEKHRLPYAIEQRSSLDRRALEFIDGFDRIGPVSRRLEPTLTTRYERVTLLEPSSMSRVTIDTNLEVEAADGSALSLPEMAVVETKTSGPPCAIDHFLWSLHQRPTRISKYCTGLAALTPGLPANKWNRVLRTHFGWTPEPVHPFLGDDQLTLSQPPAWGHTFEACPSHR
ncbi:MAG: VTC domain-containing protein, partial [Acidimicrobiia bacterium]|nr:VTC domain-containing protein [Acidimicrobiia bacterium]